MPPPLLGLLFSTRIILIHGHGLCIVARDDLDDVACLGDQRAAAA